MKGPGVYVAIGVGLLLAAALAWPWESGSRAVPAERREVIFWHFWGGRERAVVEEIADRFNRSQREHFVRPVAMPGSNLDLKCFLAVTGGDPPDLVNQDDPIVADWAHRGVLTPLAELASPEEYARLETWLLPPARRLGSYRGRLYALCNGLDIRALYYDRRLLAAHGLQPPQTLAQLDAMAERIAPAGAPGPRRQFGYLPDPRRLWAWGTVFGGRFYDRASGRVTADDPRVVAALEWMAGYARRYGPDSVAAFRQGDQGLAGAAFPLLAGRYGAVMDGQWRVAEIARVAAAARARGEPPPEIGVVPLPPPEGGRPNAGWVNGNFFVVPRGAGNRAGAWAFMKFWSGFDGHEAEAARACAAGGWIPASQQVIDEPAFRAYVDAYPLFETFVRLAASPEQFPTPSIPVAPYYYSQVVRAAEEVLYKGAEPRAALAEAQRRVAQRLAEVTDAPR